MSDKATTDRRGFLKWAGLGTAGAVAGSVGAQSAGADEINPDNKSARYTETDHVKKVYELARF